MVKNRTQTQVACDGVRVAWRVAKLSMVHEQETVTLSIDGIKFDHVSRAQLMSTAPVVAAIGRTNQTGARTATAVADTLHQWMRSMDGVRLQPRLNA